VARSCLEVQARVQQAAALQGRSVEYMAHRPLLRLLLLPPPLHCLPWRLRHRPRRVAAQHLLVLLLVPLCLRRLLLP
jgi:hypothetical protein